ncbi:MAG: choice-of-anchor Q domain-containing protein, partial [Dehalococcoidia bacterium]
QVKMRRIILLGLVLLMAVSIVTAGMVAGDSARAEGSVIYVNASATGAGDGSSWEDAYTDLQDALSAASSGDEIWVAAGTYVPGTERWQSFSMKNGVGIYGGFPASGNPGWEDRDWVENETILSGDIGVPGDASDNSYNVFYHSKQTGLNNSAILNGFIITGGAGDGGALHNHNSSPTITNCVFSDNCSPWGDGGAIYNNDSSPTLVNCVFHSNSAGGDGGAIYNKKSSPVITNCVFHNNSAGGTGGALFDFNVPSEVTNCILRGNSPGEIGNKNATSLVTYSDIQGGYEGAGNIDEEPRFVDAGSGDFRLQPLSPCVDAGDNAASALPESDFFRNARIRGSTVDMGVHEAPITVVISVELEAPRDAPAGWEIPVSIDFYDSGASWEAGSGEPPAGDVRHSFSGTTEYNSETQRVEYRCTGVTEGTYDILVKGETTLANIRDDVTVAGSFTVDMGTLLEGDCNGNGYHVNARDWAVFQPAWLSSEGDPKYDPRADLNRDGHVNAHDWSLFQPKWLSKGPREIS